MTEFQNLPKSTRVIFVGSVGFFGTAACAYLLVGLLLEFLRTRRFAGFDIWAVPNKFLSQPDQTQYLIGLGATGVVILLTGAFIAKALQDASTRYGDAVFESPNRLVRDGYATRLKLTDQAGSEIVFAKFGRPMEKNALYYKPTTRVQKPHAMVIAPSGSGKTTGFVIPNALHFSGATVILDIKGEIFQATAGARAAMGQHVLLFNPDNPKKSHSYNPLRRALRAQDPDTRWEEVLQVATQLFDTPSASAQGFMGGVESMFCAMAMLAIKRDRPYISEILHLIKTTPQSSYEDMAQEVGYSRAADEFMNLAAEEPRILRSTISVMNNSGLQLWRNPSVARVTQGNDINFEDLRRNPASIYFSVPGKKVKEWQTLIRLFFLDLVNTLETHEPGPDEPHQVLILLDEFQRLGKLERVIEAYDTIRSFGGRISIISQSLSRLQDIYGRDSVRAMLANAGTQMFAASEDPEVRDHVSRSIGDKTVKTQSKSRARGKFDMGTLSEREEGLRLLRPEHVGRLPPDQLILLREGKMPVLANKIRYYEDPFFMQFSSGQLPVIKGNHVDLETEHGKDAQERLQKHANARVAAEETPAAEEERLSEEDHARLATFDQKQQETQSAIKMLDEETQEDSTPDFVDPDPEKDAEMSSLHSQ
ncbi:type IV secretory system conjugative DNA transfer family protein, partial [uncultured Ruegeria sp.]|uniref:type IV secretory system conjugative DNA transfer family protein n=1 Tax=uncultured Ruegeria sp. TaxID=259304 RepID=UPI002615BD0F